MFRARPDHPLIRSPHQRVRLDVLRGRAARCPCRRRLPVPDCPCACAVSGGSCGGCHMPVVMDADRIGRTLTRIAHEILERNRGARRSRARRHPHARRAARAAARRAAAARSPGDDVPTGALDITLYRDDLMRQPVGPQPVVGSTEIPFSIDDRGSCSSTTCSTPGARCARRSTRSSTSAGRRRFSSSCSSTAATASCRSRPTTSARTCRPRARESVQVRLEEIDGDDEVVINGEES